MRSVFSPSSLVPLGNIWRRLRPRIFDSYHPELHYMRGPWSEMAREARQRYFSVVNLALLIGVGKKSSCRRLVDASRSFECPQAPPSVREKMDTEAPELSKIRCIVNEDL
jgi:hypothetical protein